jgi:LPXTG-motif cell wall-anchored protein
MSYTAVGTTKSPAAMAASYAGQHLLVEQAMAKEAAAATTSSTAADMPAAATTGRPSWLLPALGVLAIGGFVYWRRRQKQKGATP